MDLERIQKAVREILLAIGEDPSREGLVRTPARVAQMYEEILCGMGRDPRDELVVTYGEKYDEIIAVKDVPFYSICEHHLVPFSGKIHMAYLPTNGRVMGISKLVRVADTFARRLQLQERLTDQIADTLMEALQPLGVMVVIEAEHLCMTMRGVKKPGSVIVTSAVRGIFKKSRATREEALRLLMGK